ncbi:gluconate 2-dehydrogenase subunit 3 family protein [Salegentibacter sp. F188]|uniref:Gluconate 2-dehydrogenase subunit 3 family protein n=1 Tax=Autumnicola patrickiae TaxID=3075591 RepID=A0ABU3E1F4_9FLAO|nr:gluconate 2-dehydrogenase subunit 3 family protein [Salegentibacter sp. F188]MDT0689755.1 gluconate 2-dehydrogenase subunit 3 family protein [Salegentibacter sp. F188]
MKRRDLIKIFGISAVGLATVPFWVDSWTADELPQANVDIDDDQKLMLAGMIETIIPATDTPGAKELEVDRFVLVMVSDCFDKEVQTEFAGGFDEVNRASKDRFEKAFLNLSDAEKHEVLNKMLEAEKASDRKINFVPFVKDLTVAGYTSSKYVLENIMDYEQVPSRWDGSFPVNQEKYYNA